MEASRQLHDLAGLPSETTEPDSKSGRFEAEKNILLLPEIEPGLPSPYPCKCAAPPEVSLRRTYGPPHGSTC